MMAQDIKAELAKLNNLQECILEDVNWVKYGLALELVFEYIWSPDGKVQIDHDTWQPIILRFSEVQEFHIQNRITQSQLAAWTELPVNWGYSEVALVRYVEKSDIVPRYAGFPQPAHHIEVIWDWAEGEDRQRRLDIVFSDMKVVWQDRKKRESVS